jgi:arylformamidase
MPSRDSIVWSDGKTKKVYDISPPLSPTLPVFPGQPNFQKRPLLSLARGERANIIEFTLTSHTGMHVDSPNHFIDHMETIDRVPLNKMVGRARVFELKADEKIDAFDVQSLAIEPGTIILFKTRNSRLWEEIEFKKDYVYITRGAAEILCDRKVVAVGFDYIIPDDMRDLKRPVHHVLFEKDIILIEGLNLSDVPPGDYFLICLPLKIEGGDGAPARAILVEL